MPQTIDLAGVRRWLDRGAQLVEVLPQEEYAEEHLPGAVNIPLKSMDAASVEPLHRGAPVIVYCHDCL
jgi:rhodanese-related sulfurtransferase